MYTYFSDFIKNTSFCCANISQPFWQLLLQLLLYIRSQSFKNQEPWCMFLCAPNNKFACTIVHHTFCAPQLLVRARVYANVHLAVHLLQILEQKVNLRFIPLSINPETSPGILTVFIEKETGPLSTQSERPDNFYSTVLGTNEHGWFKTSRMLVNILSGTPRLCRNGGFAQITFFKRLQTYMTGKCTLIMYITLS